MGVSLSKRARATWLVAIAAMAVLTWLSRATASGFPDQTGWVALAMFAVAAVSLLRTRRPRP